VADTDRFDELELETMLLGRHLTPLRQSKDDQRQLERSGYTLLARIQTQGAMTIGELSEMLGLDVSTLNRQTAALVKPGYLVRVPDPDGGIARKFEITEAGADRLECDRQLNVRGLRILMDQWDPDDVERFVTLMRRFNTEIEDRVGQPWPRYDERG
jgi:DNA-binding MarR family transcriptional regulator